MCWRGWTTATSRCGRANGLDVADRFRRVALDLGRGLRTFSRAWSTARCAPSTRPGVPRFQLLQNGKGTLVYYLFDVLEVEGRSYVGRPFDERRAELERIVDERAPTIRLSRAFDDGEALLEQTGAAGPRRHHLEAPRGEVRGRPPQQRLAEGQAPRQRRVRDRRVPAGAGPPQPPRLAGAGGAGRHRSHLRRPGRRRAQRGRHRRAARGHRRARCRRAADHGCPPRPPSAPRPRRLVQAHACAAAWSSPSGRTTAASARRCSRGSSPGRRSRRIRTRTCRRRDRLTRGAAQQRRSRGRGQRVRGHRQIARP